MSRIGKLPVPIVSGVKVTVDGAAVSIQGPKGSLRQPLPRGITAAVEGDQIVLRRREDTKPQKALHGLSRALLANAVHGVSRGFEKKLEIQGVGYAAEVKGRQVQFKLGYSHPVLYPVPDGIAVKVERSVVTVSGADRQQVGQVAAEIRDLRRPDVYKHKGIRYAGEQLRKKAGKTGAK
jgi:large subunit ribosomal protein L6